MEYSAYLLNTLFSHISRKIKIFKSLIEEPGTGLPRANWNGTPTWNGTPMFV